MTDLENKSNSNMIYTLFCSFSSNYIPGFGAGVQDMYPYRGHIPVC